MRSRGQVPVLGHSHHLQGLADPAHPRRVEKHDTGAAQKPVKGQSSRFPGQIPQSYVNGRPAPGLHAGTSGPTKGRSARECLRKSSASCPSRLGRRYLVDAGGDGVGAKERLPTEIVRHDLGAQDNNVAS